MSREVAPLTCFLKESNLNIETESKANNYEYSIFSHVIKSRYRK